MKRTRREAKETARRKLHYEHRRRAFEVLFHRLLYYVFSMPIVTDAEYDAMERALARWEKENGASHPRSPTRTVGSDKWLDYPVEVRARARAHFRDLGMLDERRKKET